MFEVAAQIAKAHERRLEIEECYPEMPPGKSKEDRAKMRMLHMSKKDRDEWDAIGLVIEDMRKAL